MGGHEYMIMEENTSLSRDVKQRESMTRYFFS